ASFCSAAAASTAPALAGRPALAVLAAVLAVLAGALAAALGSVLAAAFLAATFTDALAAGFSAAREVARTGFAVVSAAAGSSMVLAEDFLPMDWVMVASVAAVTATLTIEFRPRNTAGP